ncbi:hypothetical protein CRG98_014687 [Punica granatum]|uniref:Uncharacterized protein n=1 Tax=Punica granatum TaxID=22663 RepID=A0A2I0K8M6_PUNGR|nr:hypothetical protein CRG98_014687 [Punica granatum]
MVELKVLNLQFNSFYGEIPVSICKLGYLRVLNLAHNNLSGSIPLCFDNLTTMSDPKYPVQTNNSYWFGVEVQMKSITQVYTSALRYLFSIDLSNNKLNGDIPTGLTRLCNLENLNLSQNDLEGGIPPEIADMKRLESFDLSINQLSGPIPRSLSELDSLGYLNLSFNQLSGPIPSIAHLSTFTNESYIRNDALYGPPLSKNCSGDHGQSEDIHNQHGDDSAVAERASTMGCDRPHHEFVSALDIEWSRELLMSALSLDAFFRGLIGLPLVKPPRCFINRR